MPSITHFGITASPLQFPDLKKLELADNTFRVVLTTILIILLILTFFKYYCPIGLRLFRRFKGMSAILPTKLHTPAVETLFLAIGSAQRHINIRLMEIPFRMQHYQVRATKFISAIDVVGCLRPSLNVTGPELVINHKFAPLAFRLHEQVYISLREAYVHGSAIYTAAI